MGYMQPQVGAQEGVMGALICRQRSSINGHPLEGPLRSLLVQVSKMMIAACMDHDVSHERTPGHAAYERHTLASHIIGWELVIMVRWLAGVYH
jgi:hypothetical protein